MCGRYTIDEDNEEMSRILETIRHSNPRAIFKTGEIFPTNFAPLLTGEALEPTVGKWGFPGYKTGDILINARAETVAQKPSFREGYAKGRCIIPTTGFYEWSPQKQKFRFQLPETSVIYLAGICNHFTDGVRYVILTTEANRSVSAIHPRMPVILTGHAIREWVMNDTFAGQYLQSEMPALVSYPDG